MKRSIAIQNKNSVKKERKKTKKIASIDTIIMDKERISHQKEDNENNYEWLNSLIIAMPDEVVREKIRKLFSKNSDKKEALVDKLMMDIL